MATPDQPQQQNGSEMDGVQNEPNNGPPAENSAGPSKPPMIASGLSERIELLDAETRSCWRRIEDLEDEEASLNHRLMKLEKWRRHERLEILGMEQACQAVEVAMLQAQEDEAECDAQAGVLGSLAQDAAEDAEAAASGSHRAAEGGGAHDTSPRLEGAAALVSTLRELPVHEERRKQLVSVLQEAENETRSQIAEAARAAAELRRSAKKLDAERLPLEDETTALRRELAEMTGEDEVRAAPAAHAHANGRSTAGVVSIRARMARAKQIGDGVKRRLQHAANKLESVRPSLAQGPAKRLEEEEQQSLELMQAIAQAKGRLHSHGKASDRPRDRAPPSSSTNRGGGGGSGGGRVFSPPRPSQPRLQMQPSRGSVGRSNHQPGGRHTWEGRWS